MVDFAKNKHDERQAEHVKFDFLGMSPDFYTKILDDLPVAIMAVDPETFVIIYINKTSICLLRQIEALLPRGVDSILGSTIDIFHSNPAHQRSILSTEACMPHRARISLGGETLDLQISRAALEGGEGAILVLTWSIVTQQVEVEKHIWKLAHYDALTGLENRHAFGQRLSREDGAPLAGGLLLIGLDGFETISDLNGRHVGEGLIVQVADRLRLACQGQDAHIGRLEGNQFAMLVPYAERERLEAFAHELVALLGRPYWLGQKMLPGVTVVIGIAQQPQHGMGSDRLIARADIAMRVAKSQRKSAVAFFQLDMEQCLLERVLLEQDLRRALETGEGLFVFYQPIMEISSGRVSTREALVRWHRPQWGWVSPADFIPIAEETDLIEHLGAFVLRRACWDALVWEDSARVAVNMSGRQFGRQSLVPAVMAALDETGLPAERLEIEITETAALAEDADVLADLHCLHAMGVRISLDDFGTGYSSFSHLRTFHVDKIKIDGSFVRDAAKKIECASIVRAAADIGRRLGIPVVAECVETEEQFHSIVLEGCTEAQGYFISVPKPTARDMVTINIINRSEDDLFFVKGDEMDIYFSCNNRLREIYSM